MADKFCTNCGTRNPEQTKFCTGCGSPLTAVPPAQQAMGQPPPQPMPPMGGPMPPSAEQPFQNPPYAQPYPMAPMAPSMPAAPPAKKKRKGLKVLLGFLISIALIVTAILLLIGKASSMDYYKIQNDKVPSVKYVLGEKRKVLIAGAASQNGINGKYFAYKSDTPQQDIDTYLTVLLEKEGFIKMVNPDTMEVTGVGRNSVEPGYHIEVLVEPASDGYVVTVYYAQGEIEIINTSTDDGRVEPTSADTGTTTAPTSDGTDWKAVLPGMWHANNVVGSGFAERWRFDETGDFIYGASQYDMLDRLLFESGTWKVEGNRLLLTIEWRIVLEGGEVIEVDGEQAIEGASPIAEPLSPVETKTLVLGDYGQDPETERACLTIGGVTYYDYSGQPNMFDGYYDYMPGD